MANGVGVPADIAEQMGNQGQQGIGGGAKENSHTSGQRNAAMNVSAPEEAVAEADEPDPEVETNPECTNSTCKRSISKDWNFCPFCKTDLLTGDAIKKLDIEFTEEDVEEYIFKGCIIKEISFLGKRKATVKTSQSEDFDAIDDYIMNGDWAKNSDGTDRNVSDFYTRQMNAICMTASCLLRIGGESIGETLPDRVAWLQQKGATLVDILTSKTSLFNQAFSEHLKKEDTLLGPNLSSRMGQSKPPSGSRCRR